MMKHLFEYVVIAASTLIAVTYFVTSSPSSEAMTESESSMFYVVIQRVQNIEKQKGIKVPDNLKLNINGVPEK